MNNKMQLSILVVEDNPGHRNIYKNYFEGAGHKVSFATNYEEAIKILKDEIFDVAIIDVKLDNDRYDNRDGLRIAGAISKMAPAPRVILATGYADEIDSQTAQYVESIFDKSNLGNEKLVLELVNVAPSSVRKPQLLLTDVGYSLQKIIERTARDMLPVEAVYEQILVLLTPLVGAEVSSLFIVQENQLVSAAIYPQSAQNNPPIQAVEDSISGLSVRRYHYVYEPDLHKESDTSKLHKPGLKTSRSSLAIPVVFGIEPVAVLNFESSKSRAFDKIDKDLLEKEIAPIIAFAIHDAILQQSLIDQTKNVINLSDISKELNSIIQSGEERVAELILHKTIEFLKCAKTAIYILDEQGGGIVYSLFSHIGLSEEYAENSQNIVLSSPRAYTVRTNLPVYINDIEDDGNLSFLENASHVQSIAQREGYRAMLEVPLQIREITIGSLVAYYPNTMQFKEGSEELALANMFANHAAIALDNARQYRELEEAKKREKLAVIGELSGDIVHRMNSPLGAIKANVSIIQIEFEDLLDKHKELKDALSEINSIANEAINMIQEMRENARSKVLEYVDIRKTIEIALREIAIPENIHIVNLVASQIAPLQVIANKNLVRVFKNLFLNAIQAMPSGGEITIDAQVMGNYMETTIEDTGIGISNEFRDEIFNLLSIFSKTKADGGGHGLGLWYCRAYVEACGGQLPSPESIVGKGTKFTVRLPIPKDPKG